jgi:hypothetical protein
VAAVVQISSRYAFDSRNRNCAAEQSGTLHPDANHAKTNAVTRCHCLRHTREWMRVEQNSLGKQCASGNGGSSAL